MTLRKQTCRRAFTLIELLVVISVIMILAALVMPAMMKAVSMSERARCGSNLRQIGNAFILYANQWGRYFPANWISRPGRGDDDLSPLYTGNFCQDLGVFSCPSTEDKAEDEKDIRYKRSQRQPDGTWGQLSYEYCGEVNPGLRYAAHDVNTRLAWLCHDDDGKNVNTQIDGDNHGSAGANMLFLDCRVEWHPPQGWYRLVIDGHMEWRRVTGWPDGL